MSAVTFSEATAYMEYMQVPFEGYMASLLAIMEVPAILIAIFIVKLSESNQESNWKKVLHELLTGKGNIFLIGGMTIGILSGKIALSMGGSVIFGTLCASASYIAAPAAVRLALPEASPSYYLTASLAITFRFNVVIGLPIYLNFAKSIYGV